MRSQQGDGAASANGAASRSRVPVDPRDLSRRRQPGSECRNRGPGAPRTSARIRRGRARSRWRPGTAHRGDDGATPDNGRHRRRAAAESVWSWWVLPSWLERETQAHAGALADRLAFAHYRFVVPLTHCIHRGLLKYADGLSADDDGLAHGAVGLDQVLHIDPAA